jgi:hypothetical protein
VSIEPGPVLVKLRIYCASKSRVMITSHYVRSAGLRRHETSLTYQQTLPAGTVAVSVGARNYRYHIMATARVLVCAASPSRHSQPDKRVAQKSRSMVIGVRSLTHIISDITARSPASRYLGSGRAVWRPQHNG